MMKDLKRVNFMKKKMIITEIKLKAKAKKILNRLICLNNIFFNDIYQIFYLKRVTQWNIEHRPTLLFLILFCCKI